MVSSARETIDRSTEPEKRFCVFHAGFGVRLVTLMFEER